MRVGEGVSREFHKLKIGCANQSPATTIQGARNGTGMTAQYRRDKVKPGGENYQSAK